MHELSINMHGGHKSCSGSDLMTRLACLPAAAVRSPVERPHQRSVYKNYMPSSVVTIDVTGQTVARQPASYERCRPSRVGLRPYSQTS